MDILEKVDPRYIHNKEILKAMYEFHEANCMALHVSKYLQDQKAKKKRKPRSIWVRPYLTRRPALGHYDNLMRELAVENPELRWSGLSPDYDGPDYDGP